MLRRLMGKRKPSESGEPDVLPEDDEPIVHQSVPKAVLHSPSRIPTPTDRSWLDSVPTADARPPEPSDRKPSRAPAPRVRPAAAPQATGDAAPKPLRTDRPANAPTAARPRFPYGWLVVVEGPGLGEWFVLERGSSHIGSAEGQTVRLDFGDAAVAPARHAALHYDEGRHCFHLESGADAPVRLNGVEPKPQSRLRDGDVISVGGTSLRLVALCTPNFHWASNVRDA